MPDWLSLGDLLTALALIIAAVWVVAKVDKTTATLGERIQSLTDALNHLRGTMNGHASQINDHGQRIARLEGGKGGE